VKRDERLKKLEKFYKEAQNIGALRCIDMHHAKKDRHETGEACPVVKRFNDAFEALEGDPK